jgi:arginine/ornithine transport system permease protein
VINWEGIGEALPSYFDGLWISLLLLAASLLVGLALALPMALIKARVFGNSWPLRIARTLIAAFTYVFRGTPMLVQLFLIYYGLAQFESVRESFVWPALSSAWFCAVLAFGLNTCAYTTEIIAGTIYNCSAGEVEAARSLGMSQSQMLFRIVLPSSLRRALPAYSNEVIMMLHGTSLASIVTIMDLTGAAREMYSRYYSPYEAFLLVAIFYLVLTFVLVWLFNRAEKKWLRHLAPR